MNSSSLPAAALAVLPALGGGGPPESLLEREGRHLLVRHRETVGLETTDEGVVLFLSRDCPFMEIAPAFLAIYLHHLNELSPDIPLRYLNGYHHPIVARLTVRLPREASDQDWVDSLTQTYTRLDAALGLQRQAAERFNAAQSAGGYEEWPTVEVTPEQLRGLANLAETFPPLARDDYGAKPPFDLAQLESELQRLRIIDPAESWVGWLAREELRGGYFNSLMTTRLNLSQLVVTLKALYHGARYNPNLLLGAYQADFLFAIFARCRELSVAKDPR